MLYRILQQGLRRFFDALPTRRRNIVFVSATRLQETSFWNDAPLGPCLAQLVALSPRVQYRIAFANSRSLSAVYNEALAAAHPADVLVFVHDDVWLPADTLVGIEAALHRGLSRFDVVGVAGCRRRLPFQQAWMLSDIVDDKAVVNFDYLSGEILLDSPDAPKPNVYGPWPAACELLDGVLLAARAGRLRSARVGFDAQFDFHFYDLDFCRSARWAGLRLGTWPILLLHRSYGDYGDLWKANCRRYLDKWESAGDMAIAVAG
jgi:protein O-GlcNAc transferase